MRKKYSFILSFILLFLFGCSRSVPSVVTTEAVKEAINSLSFPAYSGSPYVEINSNIPAFSSDEKQSREAWEQYSELDSLGRCGVAFAVLGPELLPTEERGPIGDIRPSGWQTVKYPELIEDNYLYNRCHLIGYQLTGQNDNEKNLITGTRYLNIGAMLAFENKVERYIQETENHVLYRVTPVFEGDNLVAAGVQMEALSVEDEGEGICFNVFCYNVQPGIEIDYATGDSRVSENPGPVLPAEITTDQKLSSDDEKADFVININSWKFHLASCDSVKDMADHNKKPYTGTAKELIEMGYKPCQRCLKNMEKEVD